MAETIPIEPRSIMDLFDQLKDKAQDAGGRRVLALPDGSSLELKEYKGSRGMSWSNRAFDAVLRSADTTQQAVIRVEYDSADPLWGNHQLKVRRPEDGECGGYDYALTPTSQTPTWVPELLGTLSVQES